MSLVKCYACGKAAHFDSEKRRWFCPACEQDAAEKRALYETSDAHCGKDNVPGYESLKRVLALAYDQSACGKGKQRHANDKPFDEQPIMEIGRMVGLGGHAYQICKKAQEATGMAGRGEHDAAKAEMLGVIVYAAAAYLLLEENVAPHN